MGTMVRRKSCFFRSFEIFFGEMFVDPPGRVEIP